MVISIRLTGCPGKEVVMRTFLACTSQEGDISWLQGALSEMGHVLRVGQRLDALFALIEATGATLVFVGMDRNNMSSQCALIENLLEAKPLVRVVGIGDGFDNELVIAAMRAGYKDCITEGLSSSEVSGLVRRITDRPSALPVRREQGRLIMLVGNQPEADAALVAPNLALRMQ